MNYSKRWINGPIILGDQEVVLFMEQMDKILKKQEDNEIIRISDENCDVPEISVQGRELAEGLFNICTICSGLRINPGP